MQKGLPWDRIYASFSLMLLWAKHAQVRFLHHSFWPVSAHGDKGKRGAEDHRMTTGWLSWADPSIPEGEWLPGIHTAWVQSKCVLCARLGQGCFIWTIFTSYRQLWKSWLKGVRPLWTPAIFPLCFLPTHLRTIHISWVQIRFCRLKKITLLHTCS